MKSKYLLLNKKKTEELSLDFVAQHKVAKFFSLKGTLAGILVKENTQTQQNDLQLIYSQYFINISKQKKQLLTYSKRK